MTIDLNRVASVVRQIAAILAVVVSTTNIDHLPLSIKTVLAAAGSIILTAEHVVAAIQSDQKAINVSHTYVPAPPAPPAPASQS